MSKIYITGSVASGKTTIAKELSLRCGIPHYELDSIIYTRNGSERYKLTPEEQIQRIQEIDAAGDWIIEGTYRISCHCLLDLADKVLFLDTPLWKRRLRIFSRFIRQKLKIEPCEYKSDLKMLRLMYRWNREFEKDRVNFLSILNEYKDKLFIFTDPDEWKTVF